MKMFNPVDQVFWYGDFALSQPLQGALKTDVVVVGGGMAGLSAAQSFAERGLSVILLEKNYCGAGATGKSSGFITPDSEISLSQFIHRYGQAKAKQIWKLGIAGADRIKNNIEKFSLDCDYLQQDTLIVAHCQRAFKNLEKEYNTRLQLDYQSSLYASKELSEILNTQSYHGGLSYEGTFGINAYRYCQGMKHVLQNAGITIYEHSPAIDIQEQKVLTPHGSVEARYVVLCLDHFLSDLQLLKKEVYHVQTFLMISDQLSPQQIKAIFPKKTFMVWDTQLIYTYFRLAAFNRLLLGGGTLCSTYAKYEQHHALKIGQKLVHYLKNKFRDLKDVEFAYLWPGLIGVSKDVAPIVGFDKHSSWLYYVTACAGLPWAAGLGAHSVAAILDKDITFQDAFSPYRNCWPFNASFQSLFGTQITFALSNFVELHLK